MDFQAEFNQSLKIFPSIEGIIFVDPDGESILFEAPSMDSFDIQLTGARIPILMSHYHLVGLKSKPVFLEILYEKRFLLSITLEQRYSITAICNDTNDRAHLRDHLIILAAKFNQEIV